MKIIISKKDEKLMIDAIEKWGEMSQIGMAVEECGEFLSAINKYYRGRIDKKEVMEEVADVILMMLQMSVLLGRKDLLDDMLTQKLLKLNRLLSEKK